MVPQLLLDFGVSGQYFDNQSDISMFVLSVFTVGFCSLLVDRWVERYTKANSQGGRVASVLRENLFRKYYHLRYEQFERQEPLQGIWTSCILKEVDIVVEDGWLVLFVIIEQIAGLFFGVLVVILVLVVLPVASGSDSKLQPISFTPLVSFLVIPILLLLLLSPRNPESMRLSGLRQQQLQETLVQWNWVSKNWPLLTSYEPDVDGLQVVCKRLLESSNAYSAAGKRAALFNFDSQWLVEYLTEFASLSFLVFGTFALIERKRYGQGFLTIGSFFAILKIYAKIGQTMSNMLSCYSRMQNAAVSLKNIANVLNADDGGMDRIKAQAARSTKWQELLASKTAAGNTNSTGPLLLENVSFQYSCSVQVFSRLNVQIAWGSSFIILGPPAIGKHSLMHLLGRVISADSGVVLAPPNATICTLPETVHVIPGIDAYSNISICAAEWVQDDDIKLLTRCLGLRHVTTSLTRISTFSGGEVKGMKDILHMWGPGEDSLIGLARGFVADVDILLAPIRRMNTETQLCALRSMRLWHRARGLKHMLHILEMAFDECKSQPSFIQVPKTRNDAARTSDSLLTKAEKLLEANLLPSCEGRGTTLGLLLNNELQVQKHCQNGMSFDYALFLRGESVANVVPFSEFMNEFPVKQTLY
eukprot:gnl/MRDRNA2_/MRDRNA2_162138_c0_seq1.p1 gnl/MRDRNA2_/MRDRNA2_162138_c0~~gnl/MRDRNA2_/MRDRNA2_162138_c0_seq1.p1  ORF type:complete len:661 (+),score=66.60 gnl/MRDRNA2_/MRDRNA2_162138_c0_seq1:51-1985(+)